MSSYRLEPPVGEFNLTRLERVIYGPGKVAELKDEMEKRGLKRAVVVTTLGGFPILEATRTAALLRLRPIMMTALVAALGLLPAALSTGVGSDTQKPFALVIVGGLFSRLLISVFLMPVLYAMFARDDDHLEV